MFNQDGFYIFYAIASLGVGITWTMPVIIVQHWFIKKRGMFTGIVACGPQLGLTAYVPLANYLISMYGWRNTYIILGIATWIMLMQAASVLVSNAAGKGLKTYGAEKLPTVDNPNDSKIDRDLEWTVGEAIRTKSFLYLGTFGFCAFGAMHVLIVHAIPFAINIGISKTSAAFAWGMGGLISIVPKIVGPIITEKIGWKWGLVILSILCGLSVLWFTKVNNLWMFYVFVLSFSIGMGGQMALTPLLSGLFFPGESMTTIYGIISSLSLLGPAIAAFIGGLAFHRTGRYYLAF